jgi:hypothetical protein
MRYPLENYFNLTDILSAITWLLLISMIVFYRSTREDSKRLSNLYIFNFYFKVLFATAFAYYYIVEFNGGDTLAYWDGAKAIQKLIFEDPLLGLEHLLSSSDSSTIHHYFSSSTGYPPIWIYIEPESYFVCKVVAIVGIFTSQSYLAVMLVFSFLFAHANWKLFKLTTSIPIFEQGKLPYFVLFIPSVSFWCTGISKDTLIAISFYYIIIQFYEILILRKQKLKAWMLLIFYLFIIYHVRSFMLLPLFLPLLVAFGIGLNKKLKLSPIFQLSFNALLLGVIMAVTVGFLSSDFGTEIITSNSLLQEAIVIQGDFSNNLAYGKNVYSLGEIDNSPLGILKAIPISVFSGIFQPLPWNGLSISLFINAMESVALIFIFFQLFFTKKLFRWFRAIRKNELLIFCLVFVITLAFMTGFTSIIFGVLVRIRAPLLPILGILLSIKISPNSISKAKDI